MSDLRADNQYDNLDDQIANIAAKREVMSMQQCAEGGMRAVQSSFPTLTDTMVFEECNKRRIIFNCEFHLLNLCPMFLISVTMM
jgi:hypothetical protein